MNIVQIKSLRYFMNIIQIYFYNIEKHSSFSFLFIVDILFSNHVIKLIEFINLIQLNNY